MDAKRTKLHPNTTKFANALYAIYAAWAIVAGVLLLGGRHRSACVLALAPFILRKAAQLWTHHRVFPYRNGVVSSHMARALDGSGWLAWREARLAAGAGAGAGTAGKGKGKVRILDFGCGMGDTSSILRGILGADADITSVDVYRSERWVGGASTRVVYDGATLPFGDGSFDLAVCGQVLHHIPDNARSVAEVCRVATHVLVVEDLVRRGTAQEAFCHFWDSLWNWDFFEGAGTPHTNREHGEWLRLFEEDCAMELRHFHATSLAFKKDVVADDPAQFKALANGFYVIAQKKHK